MSKREVDLGRLMQQVGRRIEDEGQAASQVFYEWERPRPMPAADPVVTHPEENET